jgi:hypothetical protein
MGLHQTLATRFSCSLWSRWFERNDQKALSLASGTMTLRRLQGQSRDDLPPEVVSLLAIADVSEIVLALSTSIDKFS